MQTVRSQTAANQGRAARDPNLQRILASDASALPKIWYFEYWMSALKYCSWRDHEDTQRRMAEEVAQAAEHSSQPLVAPFDTVRAGLSPEVQLAAGRRLSERLSAAADSPLSAGDFRNLHHPGARLRIGYLSPDLREHAVGHLLPELFELHDRTRFEIHIYDLYPATAGKEIYPFREKCEHYTDLSHLPLSEMVKKIRGDEIQLLVDLAGFTQYNRSEIVASRLAPIQISYMGYPGSMGADFIDYVIGSALLIPPEHEAYYSEKIVRLPGAHNIVSRWPDPRGKVRRASVGLPDDAFVLSCFNASYKLDPRLFDRWMRILSRVPNAVLWLLGDNNDTRENLAREARHRGVDPQRLIFSDRVSVRRHMDRLPLADLYLDTVSYSAFTTLTLALWAGLPSVALLGDSYATRMGAVAVSAAGLDELVVETPEAYEELVVELALEPQRLAGIRKRLIEKKATSPLFDSQRYTRHLEYAYERAWERHLAGEEPAHIEVPELD